MTEDIHTSILFRSPTKEIPHYEHDVDEPEDPDYLGGEEDEDAGRD